MRTFIRLALSSALIAAVTGVFASSAGAHTHAASPTGNLTEFCAARVALDPSLNKGKAATLAVFNRLVANAPATIAGPVTEIRDQYKKKGEQAFDKLFDEIAVADEFTYTNCPGAKVNVVATDYQFQGLPATLEPGVTNFKLTNNAPKEDHEMGLGKLLPANESMSVEEILALPEKKADRLFDRSVGGGMYAPAGESGYMTIDLKPGKYVYACFIPVGGKKNGQPHAMEGMYGSFTVQ